VSMKFEFKFAFILKFALGTEVVPCIHVNSNSHVSCENGTPPPVAMRVPPEVSELQVVELRKRTAVLPDEYLVVLVGDMITEEALPTYMTMLNTLDGVRDDTGASPSPWAKWTRMWTAEENRHGALSPSHLYPLPVLLPSDGVLASTLTTKCHP
jgi:hypothetical protein